MLAPHLPAEMLLTPRRSVWLDRCMLWAIANTCTYLVNALSVLLTSLACALQLI